ncbi:MAG: divalent-cation tolerance protein CutA [Hirschia sp.]|nr:divalent-cation tolerance protein CutA [Hirschia sp.]MBF19095.1 divalent-cation tolerance protein CutA [Hirschia sp.]MBF20229.1 divalent-cation tolerance protein CutA [Hirschia sp.]|tara:strand:- start:170 stop:487 length:318 start_codon:yes stop_codon:yes gene_type:complete
MTDIILIRINCPDENVAQHIGETLVRSRLAACINIEGPISSIFWWEGEVERGEEWVLLAKAPAANWSKIEAEVADLHPDEVPAILAIPCVQANARYSDWLKSVSG